MALFDFFKRPPSGKQLRDMLPSLHSFVDVVVTNGPKGSVCVETTGTKSFSVRALPGMSTGQNARIAYENNTGKYRFTATITGVDGQVATFAVPARIETVQKFKVHKRSNVRVDTTVAAQWRFTPAGKIETEWQKANVSDISRAGCSLTTDKPVKTGAKVDLKAPLLDGNRDVTLRAEVVRVGTIETSKKSNVGLKFIELTPERERAIVDFINRRQTTLRSRGLA